MVTRGFANRAGSIGSVSDASLPYTIRIICDDVAFTALRDDWAHLLADAVDANTFMSHAWLESWWLSYRPNASLRVVVAERSGVICGIAPMMIGREGGLGRIFRRLRFLGDGTSETDHMNFIVQADDRAGILAALLREIDRMPWDIAHFNHVPRSSSNADQLLEFATKVGWLTTCKEVACPRKTLPGSSDELMRALPGRLRTAIRSAKRDLEANHSIEFGLCDSRGELAEGLETLYRNHGSRWRAKGEEGVFVNENKRSFYERLSSRLLEEGSLRFFHLKVDGKVIAQQFCFQHGDTVFLLQEGFDFDYAKLNVGNVLRAMVFEHLIAAGIRYYDFLAGTSRHKQSWSDAAPTDLSVRACRPTSVGLLAHHLPQLIATSKRFFERDPTLTA